MAFTYNNSDIDNINYNNQVVDIVKYNGQTVWESWDGIVTLPAIASKGYGVSGGDWRKYEEKGGTTYYSIYGSEYGYDANDWDVVAQVYGTATTNNLEVKATSKNKITISGTCGATKWVSGRTYSSSNTVTINATDGTNTVNIATITSMGTSGTAFSGSADISSLDKSKIKLTINLNATISYHRPSEETYYGDLKVAAYINSITFSQL